MRRNQVEQAAYLNQILAQLLEMKISTRDKQLVTQSLLTMISKMKKTKKEKQTWML